MATKMSYNYFHSQNGKYSGSVPQSASKDMEVSQDLHLKMSKKIAQLTKVIYALNTKNDEHEAIVQNLKETHEEELQKLLADTKKKIAVYQSRVSAEVDSKSKIESLEATIVQYQRHQEQALSDFENFKRKAEEQLCNVKKEHAEKMLQISQDVLTVKKEFSENVDKFEEFRKQFESNKQKEIDEIVRKHESELESVRNFQGSQNEQLEKEVSRLNEKHKNELEALHQKYEELQNLKSKTEEDYELKLQKAQSFYEKELEVLKNEQSASQDSLVQSLKEQQENMKKDFQMLETELKKQIDSLVRNLADSEEKVENYEAKITQLENTLHDTDSNSKHLIDQLKELNDKLESSQSMVTSQQQELSSLNDKYSEKSSMLDVKTALVTDLETKKLQQGEIISNLESQLERLQSKLNDLENEKSRLHHNQKNLSEQQLNQLKSLQQAIEDLTIEKQTMQQRYEREIQGLKDRQGNRERELEESQTNMLTSVRKDLEDQLERERKESSDKLTQIKQEWQNKFDSETKRLIEEKETLLSEFERVKSELFSKLKEAESEVKRLENSVQDSQLGLGTASTHINNLKEAAATLKTELDNTRSDLKSAKITSATLQAELDKLKLQHESQLAECELSANSKLEDLKSELDSKWSETLQNETSKLRKQLTDQSESDRRSMVMTLTLKHEKEVADIIHDWESKVEALTLQITDLQRAANKTNVKSAEEMETIRKQMELLEKKLRQEMLEASEEYSRKIGVMESAQENQLQSLIQNKNQEISDLEKRLKDKHMEDLQIQLTAHRAAVQNIQEQADKLRHDRETSLIKQHQQEIDKLRLELSERLEKDLEVMKKEHEDEIRAARIELERAVEISKQKDRDNNSRIEELQGEISKRERTIRNLEDEVRSLKRAIEQLKKDIKDRDQDIKKIQQESKNKLKQLELDFEREYQRHVDNLKADHIQEIQQLVSEFNKAQELLKDKISAIQIQLEEAEERYRNRDSRPEDLELIMQLRDSIQEREMRVKELIDEKRFFQLELVNRETNFNKIFNTSPSIGVINPLNAAVKPKGKKGEKQPLKHSSAPTLSQRLDPIPNSPIHEARLNPSKPLPMPAFNKKYVQ